MSSVELSDIKPPLTSTIPIAPVISQVINISKKNKRKSCIKRKGPLYKQKTQVRWTSHVEIQYTPTFYTRGNVETLFHCNVWKNNIYFHLVLLCCLFLLLFVGISSLLFSRKDNNSFKCGNFEYDIRIPVYIHVSNFILQIVLVGIFMVKKIVQKKLKEKKFLEKKNFYMRQLKNQKDHKNVKKKKRKRVPILTNKNEEFNIRKNAIHNSIKGKDKSRTTVMSEEEKNNIESNEKMKNIMDRFKELNTFERKGGIRDSIIIKKKQHPKLVLWNEVNEEDVSETSFKEGELGENISFSNMDKIDQIITNIDTNNMILEPMKCSEDYKRENQVFVFTYCMKFFWNISILSCWLITHITPWFCLMLVIYALNRDCIDNYNILFSLNFGFFGVAFLFHLFEVILLILSVK